MHIDGIEVGKVLKDLHNSIYGKKEASNIFAGGNAGMAIIGMGLMQLAQSVDNMADSLESIATAITESKNNITINVSDLLPKNIITKGAEPKAKHDSKSKGTV